MVFLWFLLYAVVTRSTGTSYGIPYLFLDPEYLGVVGYFSFQLLGICFGLFFLTWNMTTYILLSYRYPFVATLQWPVAMFTLNNAIIPLVFLVVYTFNIIDFQLNEMMKQPMQVFWSVLGFYAGFLLVVLIVSIYFVFTNKNITRFLQNNEFDFKPKDDEWFDLDGQGRADKTEYYLSRKFRIRPVREVAHYDDLLLKKVFQQHHANAFIFIVFTLFTLIGLGFLIDNPVFEIPAAGSVFLFFSLIVSLTGFMYYWTGEWGTLAFLAFFFSINYFSQFSFFNYNNQAYGVDYSAPKVEYSQENLRAIVSEETINQHKKETEQILNNWIAKQREGKSRKYKPKMVIVLSSGGGAKASLFTMKVLQTADSLTESNLMKNTVMMSGASGGMLGIGYFRELYLRSELGLIKDLYSEEYSRNAARDLLNKICASVVTNDLYYPFQSREIFGYNYVLDRGMMMEQAFNQNTGGILDKPLSEYTTFERAAAIPILFAAGTSVSDSRKVIFSAQPASYMMKGYSPKNPNIQYDFDAIDFGTFFHESNPYNIRFSSVLRINATYPLILPNVSLPSDPQIDVMDAGLRDNYGVEMAVRFINVFSDWINTNTSGVVVVQIRDIIKEKPIKDFEYKTFISRFLSPLGNLYSNVTITQDYQHDYMLNAISNVLQNKLEVVRFDYMPLDNEKKASMSFRLSEKEIEHVLKSAVNQQNQQSFRRLTELLEN